ncbi:MAG TPA: hypothetical protein VMN37_06765, partial [Gemmatimonadales bacterium]|nr:hypothetical protein [Gemmatimonadales bacterium]
VAATARARSILEVERRATIGVGRISARLGRLAEARQALGRILAIARDQNRPAHRESLFVAASIALATDDTGRAIRDFDGVLREDGWHDGRRSLHSRAPLVDLAWIVLPADPARALAYARGLREVALVDSLAEVRSMDVGEADLLAAHAHAALGFPDSALRYAGAAVTALAVGAGPAHRLTLKAGAFRDSLQR